MNTLKTIFATIAVSVMLFFTACVKGDFDTPDILIPSVDFEANTTIPELIAMHTAGGLELIDTNIIIKGKVVANDETGNFYKQLIIEDENAGLQIQIDEKSLYTTYKVGQRIYVKCEGLALGEYGGNLQLGYIVGGAIGRIPSSLISQHLFLDSLPGNPIPPISMTIPTLSSGQLNMLIKLDSVHFPDAGQAFSSLTSSTNHDIMDQNGNTLILRTSNYATFAQSLIPSGIGSATGVLSIYNGDYQMYIRDLNDLQGFSK